MIEVGEYRARIHATYYGGGHPLAWTAPTKNIDEARADGMAACRAHGEADRIHILVAVRDAYDGCIHEDIVDEINIPR